MARRVFLTGATGAVGAYVCRHLLEAGYTVTALVRRPVEVPGAETVVGDLRRLELVADAIRTADAVVHFASTRSRSREEVLLADVLGTAKLLDAWSSGPLVYASSQTVYGVPRAVLRETDPLEALEWYDLGKIACELQVRRAARAAGQAPAVSFRLPIVFVAAPDQFLDLVFRECLAGRTFFFDSEAGLERYGTSFIGPADTARAVAAALTLRADDGGAYNVAAGFCSWKDLIDAFARLGRTRPRVVVRPGGRPGPSEARLPQSRSELATDVFRGRTGFVAQSSWEALVDDYLATLGTRRLLG